jgi:hypothetical protein
MFASIRIYDSVSDVSKVAQGVEKLVIPILKEQEGFISYNLVAAGIDSVISISTFETFEQAEDANTVIRQVVKDTMSSLMPNPPKAIVGEVISYRGK